MKIEKREVDSDLWRQAVANLLGKVWTRQQAAEHVGLPYSTFCKRLKYEGVLEAVNEGASHGNAGLNNGAAKVDPDRHQRYSEAMSHALATGQVADAARRFSVNFQVLARRVRAAKMAGSVSGT